MRAALCIWLGLLMAPYALPQTESRSSALHGGVEEVNADPWIWWKWANFAILAAGLGYLINKHAGPYYNGQQEEIQRGIAESAKIKQDAEARAARIETRLAGLPGEIEKLKDQSRAEMSAEGDRIAQETERHVKRLKEQARQEIELMTKAAQHQIKAYSADLALQLAEQRIQADMRPEIQEKLVNAFLADLKTGSRRGKPAGRVVAQ